MTHNYHKNFRSAFIWLFLLFTALTFGQNNPTYNKQGEKQGVVRIKVNKATGTILKSTNLKTKRGIITTGVAALDAVSSTYQASNMTRLFPENPNPKFEAKLRKHGLDLWYEVKVNSNEDAAGIARKYQELGEVTVAETERLKVVSTSAPIEVLGQISSFNSEPFNDPYLPEQWHYNNTGQTGYPGIGDVNLYKAWEITAGSADVIVSVHDQGIDIEHEDLKDNIWVNTAELNGTEGVDDDGNGFIDDIHGWNYANNTGTIDAETHGTHVGGTISAVNNNGIGVAGIAGGTGNHDGAKLMSLQILGGNANAANSYIYAADNGAVISQNSWGYQNPGNTEQAVQDAINYFIAEAGDYAGSPMKGGIVIFAAGNANSNAQWYPGYYSEVLTVSSLGPEGIKASYSNYGTWVDIAAPGGDSPYYGNKNGVLSTLPNNKIGYLDGTSMACPHISGIAALALANTPEQITPKALWTKLLTGTKNIDALNPNYVGKLGELSDAYLAIQVDEKIAPQAIADLNLEGISQEFASLSWTTPIDQDDDAPLAFTVYYSTNKITVDNLNAANKIAIKNTNNAGDQITFNVENLYGLTTYYFAVSAEDRWGNTSLLSNVITGTTNEGPAINVDDTSKNISMVVDAVTAITATHDITILNEAEGILRWDFEARHKSTSLAYNRGLPSSYPAGPTKVSANGNIKMQAVPGAKSAASTAASPLNFEAKSLSYYAYVSNIIGEEDSNIPNSMATKFVVNDAAGFNLTDVQAYLKHDPALGPVIVEIYKGEQLNKGHLALSQEYNSYSTTEHDAFIKLNEQLYFEQGESFWLVFHVPSGNQYPLGVGPKINIADASHTYNFMSLDWGNTWTPLSDLIETEDFVWAVVAKSNNEFLGKYLTLDPNSGEISGNSQDLATLTANAETLINGTYQANIILKSNDGKTPELRLPVSLNVTNQQPKLSAVSELDFGSVFQGESKELTFTLTNIGLGNFKDISVSSSNPNFELVGYAPWQIAAKAGVNITIKYTPGSNSGSDNGKLAITSSSSKAIANIILFGVSTEPGKLKVTPESQTIDNIIIGDQITGNITIENEGASTLKYFIPGYDTNGVSENWPYDFSPTGYKSRSNHDGESSPIAYNYEDISATGESLTAYYKANGNKYKQIDMGFNFPYYKTHLNQLYIAKGGFTTFSDSFNPINTPALGNAPWTPPGYISPLGTYIDLTLGGDIYYQVKSDRVIVQYDNVTDGYSGTISAQMVLFNNGNIRFYYDNITYSESDLAYLNVLIESYDQTEGILYNNSQKRNPIYSGMAIGYDYPGPDVITAISNGSGVLLPGDKAELEIKIDASKLNEGLTNRYINIVSSDPENRQKIALIELNVVGGGEANLSISNSALDFGTLFQGATASKRFILKNEGTAASTLTSFTQNTNSFKVSGEKDAKLDPGSSLVFDVELLTDVVGDFEDVISITDANNTTFEISLKGSVIDPPAIVVDLTAIEETLNFGEKSSHPLTIENSGKANLEVVGSGNPWLSLGNKMEANTNFPNFSYTVETFKTGENYHWLDIRETGKQLPFVEDAYSLEEFYRTVTLDQPILFYGKEYSTIYIAENGAVIFEKPEEMVFNPDGLPSEFLNGIIAPYWTFGGFNNYSYPEKEVGIFTYSDENKTVISWEYLVDNFGGLGDPMSAQVIFYKNGTMKFQYKLNGRMDLMSRNTIIGITNIEKTDSVSISYRANLDHGDGLAYILSPAEKLIVEPGQTLTTNINIDASAVYTGTYAGALQLRTNVPNQELLEKPVTLTVNGAANIEPSVASIDYGSIMSYTTNEGPKSYIREFDVRNTGVASLNLSGIAVQDMASEYTIEIYMYDSWYGSWYWSNVDYLWTWPTLQPNDSSKFRITYTPQTVGAITNNVTISSNIDALIIPLTANVTLPPAFSLETAAIYSSIATPNGTDTQVASFNNANGEGELNFELSLNYLRNAMETSSVTTQEHMGSFANNKTYALHSVKGHTNVAARTQTYNTFNNTLAYEDKVIADTYFGNAGSSNFITATKFNAGAEGFTLSHIQTGIRADELTEGTINYEIRAGGTSPADAISLGSGKVSYNLSGADNFEAFLTFELEDSYAIYPNEDFYVILTYPFELLYAQGTVTEVENAAGRYTVLDGGVWYDLQESYAGYGWMVRALEATYKANAWVSLQELSNSRLETGASQNVYLDFFAEFANKGSNYAKLVITTNDPFTPIAEIPVTLHVNKAPSISNKPDLIVVKEGETLTTAIDLVDEENDEISVSLNNAPAWLTYTVENNKLMLTLAPDYDSEGVYDVALTISDSNAASTNATLAIEVMSTNRAPEVLALEDLYFETLNTYHNLNFAQYFKDPDGDDMTYSISVANTDVVTAFTNGSQFIVQTLLEGTTTLHLTATDSFGAKTEAEVNVYVGQSLGIDNQDALGLNMYPNPATDVLNITAKVGIETIEIYNINGQLILSQSLPVVSRKAVINVSRLQDGVYFVKAFAETGTSNFKFVKQ